MAEQLLLAVGQERRVADPLGQDARRAATADCHGIVARL